MHHPGLGCQTWSGENCRWTRGRNDVITTVLSLLTHVRTGRAGRPRLRAVPGLLIGQVIKRKEKRRVVGVTRRVVLGTRDTNRPDDATGLRLVVVRLPARPVLRRPEAALATGPRARSIVAQQGETGQPIVGLGPADGHLDGAEHVPLLVPVQAEPDARRDVDVGDVVFPAQDVR